MDIKYLNTDLEIESKSDLSRIVEEFGEELWFFTMAKSEAINMRLLKSLAAVRMPTRR